MVSRPVTLVQTTHVETDFSIKAMSNGEDGFRQRVWPKIHTYVYMYTLKKKYIKYEIANK